MKINIDDILCYITENGYSASSHMNNKDMLIEGFCPISNLKDNSITWIKDIFKYEEMLCNELNLVVFANRLPENANSKRINFIIGENPKGMYFDTIDYFFKKEEDYKIAYSSIVESNSIGKNVSVGHNSYICSEVIIGERVIIKNNVSIECKTVIGDDCVIGSGTVIGSSGYGYYNDAKGNNRKVPDFGGVKIGNNVEIGASVCIDRGTLNDTIIEDGVKIDNLCHIAHNVHIEENCLVIALSMLGGSSYLKQKAYIAPGALIMNQVVIGENALVGMGSVVIRNVEDRKVVAGVPAKVLRNNE